MTRIIAGLLVAAAGLPLTGPISATRAPYWSCNEKPIAACVKRHGRLSSQNGIAYKIWIVGTTRVVALANDPTDFPPQVQSYLDMTSPDQSDIFGDFDICPVEPDVPGQMRRVCVSGAEKLVVQSRQTSKPAFRLLSTWPQANAIQSPQAPTDSSPRMIR